jgi:putative transposase
MDERVPPPRKKCKRYNIPWHAHYLTFSCFRRQPFFSGKHAPLWFLEALEVARRLERFHLWSYVVMPEHAHLLIWPGEDYSISRILWRLKKPVADRAIEFVKARHPDFLRRMEHRTAGGRIAHSFWQAGGGYDRNLWTAKEIREKIRYIHENPVRRGLVEDARHWPWSSCRAWLDGVDEPLRIDKESIPVLVE